MDETAASRVQAARQSWSSVSSSSIVSFHSAFSTQEFGDRSLVFVSDYHPESSTLFQNHISTYGVSLNRRISPPVPEKVLWNYLVQIANAIKPLHEAGMAARLIDAHKMLVTDENRIRFNGCALADVLDPSTKSLAGLQSLDFEGLGNTMVWLATFQPRNKAFDHLLRAYSPRLIHTIEWLLQIDGARTIDSFVEIVSSASIDSFDAALHADDNLQFNLGRELENSRIARLLLKLNSINERPEYDDDPSWSEFGPRGQVKLFRDYVFHQVDAQGRPVMDMGHMLACLNKLDAGLEEKVPLSTRDGKSVIVVTYREIKQMMESAWMDLTRRSRA